MNAAVRGVDDRVAALQAVGQHLQEVREKAVAAQPLAPDRDTGD